MKLSIVIITSDKDYKNIPFLLDSIEKNVPLEHEVLIMDNRVYNKDFVFPNKYDMLYDMGYNAYQFEAKRKASELVAGDYVWFVDGDDLVTGCVQDLSEEADIYSFNFTLKSGATNYSHHYEERSLLFNPFSQDIGITMWAKLIKTDVVKKFYSLVPEGVKIHISEDAVAVICMSYFSQSVVFCTESCYEYNDIDCDSCNNWYTDLSKLKRWITGVKDGMRVMDIAIPKDIQQKYWVRSEDIYRNNLIDMINKWFRCCDEIKDGFTVLILENYSWDFVQWVMSCWNPMPNHSNYERMQLYESFERASMIVKRKENNW